ncbi:hypothetical protein [Rheinheimera gaetbuli]
MGNIINFMEKLGSSAEFQELTETEAMALLKQEKLVSNEASSLHPTVEMLLDARKNLVCGIEPAEEPAEQPEDAPDEDSPEEDK